jgi:hypothetical protein
MTIKTKRARQVTAPRIVLDPQPVSWRGDVLYRGIRDPQSGREWEWRESDFPGLADFLMDVVLGWHPYASKGYAFRPKGRGAGPIRKAIAKALKSVPDMEPSEVWDLLASRPPRGWKFCDGRAGKYIEGPKASDGMSYRRFQNLVREVKKQGY